MLSTSNRMAKHSGGRCLSESEAMSWTTVQLVQTASRLRISRQ